MVPEPGFPAAARRIVGRVDEPGSGEPAHVVSEHPGRERPLADDDLRVDRRLRDLPRHRRRQHEIPDRAVPVPALIAGLVDHDNRLRRGVEAVERLEPGDPRVSVPELPALFRVVEVRPERLADRRREAERTESPKPLLTLHTLSR